MKKLTITDPVQIEGIIRKCTHCSVGMIDLQGNPYVIPMNFAYHEGAVYLHSGPEGGKMLMIEKNPNVCITFCEGHELVYQSKQIACSYSMKARSVMCRGKVRFIEDIDEKRRLLDIFMLQYTDNECGYAEASVRNVKLWEVKAEKLSCISFGLRASEV